jgi:hypothetical protein
MSKEIEFRKEVMVSSQRALLGMIYPSIRAIAVGYLGELRLTMIYYLDREPNDDDFESISDVTGQILADINFSEVEEHCIYTLEPFRNLNGLTSWVYMRKED